MKTSRAVARTDQEAVKKELLGSGEGWPRRLSKVVEKASYPADRQLAGTASHYVLRREPVENRHAQLEMWTDEWDNEMCCRSDGEVSLKGRGNA